MYTLIFFLAIVFAPINGDADLAIQNADTESKKFSFNDVDFVNDYTFDFSDMPNNIQITNVLFEIELNNSFCNVFNVKHTDIPWSLLCSTKCTDVINGFGKKSNSLVVQSLGPSKMNAVVTLNYYTIDNNIYDSSTDFPIIVIVIPIFVGLALLCMIIVIMIIVGRKRRLTNSNGYVPQS